MQFIIQDDFWQLYPAAQIGIVVAHGINNSIQTDSAIEQALMTATQAAALQIGDADFATYPAIAIWREAYRTFGAKPAKFRSSIENLLRSAKGPGIRSINPLVDIYNTISLRHMLPCGGEDIGAMVGDIHLTRAAGNELFIPLGSTEEQPPSAGEVIYRDEVGVICRCWNWREAERTKLTLATTDAFLCIEVLPPIEEAQLQTACAELATSITQYLGGVTKIEILRQDQPVMGV